MPEKPNVPRCGDCRGILRETECGLLHCEGCKVLYCGFGCHRMWDVPADQRGLFKRA